MGGPNVDGGRDELNFRAVPEPRRPGERSPWVLVLAALAVGLLLAAGVGAVTLAPWGESSESASAPVAAESSAGDAAATAAAQATNGADGGQADGSQGKAAGSGDAVVPAPLIRAASASASASKAGRTTWVAVDFEARVDPMASRVRVTAYSSGRLHQYVEAESGAVRDERTVTPGYYELNWGDESEPAAGEGSTWACSVQTPIRPVDLRQEFEHVYARPGTYTVTMLVSACNVPDVVRKATVVVP